MLMPSMTRDMLGRAGITPVEEALTLLAQHLETTSKEVEKLALDKALGRILHSELRSPENLPPHPRATMDGYAVRARDTFGASEQLPCYLEITGEVQMGELPRRGPAPGTCYRIATGGFLPPGTDAVVMLEHTVNTEAGMIEVVRSVAEGGNVIAAGEDLGKGNVLLPAGHRLRPQDLGLLAGVGITRVNVRGRVRAGVLSTGDEVVRYDVSPPAGKVRDINGVVLSAMAEELGCRANYYGIAPDEESGFRALAFRALAENDLLLFSGSSSVGARDLGERILDSLGEPGVIVHGVAMKPGKPVIIAFARGKPMFGLPGHPVSASVAFEVFVRPAIQRLAGMGDSELPPRRRLTVRLMRNINSASGRRDYIRVQLRPTPEGETGAHPVLGKSGAVSTLVRAHGYLIVDESIQGLEQGRLVEVHLFD
jgi:molybdopterin molybdotransferase